MSVSGGRLVVCDASALVAWLMGETGKNTIDRLLPRAVAPASGVTEALYRAKERGHQMGIPEMRDLLVAYGLDVEPVTGEDTVRAAELVWASRTTPPDDDSLSLGDGICIAVAERLGLPLTGSDQYWETLNLSVPYHPFR